MLENLYAKVSNIKKSDSDEKIKLEVYSVVTAFILSTKVFDRNIKIKEFLDSSNKNFGEFKPYVYDNRSLILGKVLRIVEAENKLFNYNFALDIKNHLEEINKEDEINSLKNKDNSKKKTTIKKDKNYTDSLFSRFKRGE